MNNGKTSNHQSPQVMRIFYGKDCLCKENGTAKQYVYRHKLVYKTIGFHPRDYRVGGFDDNLLRIINSLNVVVNHHLGSEWKNFNFDFIFLEIKLYLINGMYNDKNGRKMIFDDNKVIQTGWCRFLRKYNDLKLNDNDVHIPNKTTRGDHAVMTYTLGSIRDLTIKLHLKNKHQPELE